MREGRWPRLRPVTATDALPPTTSEDGVAGAVFIEQTLNLTLAGRIVKHPTDIAGELAVVLLLFTKAFVIAEAVRIEQTQQRKMAFVTELFRCGCQ